MILNEQSAISLAQRSANYSNSNQQIFTKADGTFVILVAGTLQQYRQMTGDQSNLRLFQTVKPERS